MPGTDPCPGPVFTSLLTVYTVDILSFCVSYFKVLSTYFLQSFPFPEYLEMGCISSFHTQGRRREAWKVISGIDCVTFLCRIWQRLAFDHTYPSR